MCTKIQLKEFLEQISAGAKFIKFSFVSAEIFTIFLKCKVEETDIENHNKYTKEWIKKFSEFTNTTWIVHGCFPNLKRLVYRKSFWCHRSAQNKVKTSGRTKNLECKAKIDFKVRIMSKNTTKKDADLRLGLNMNINIVFNHSHLVRDPECLNQLKSSSQSDSAFYEYFNDGYTPSMAKCYHELLVIEKYGQGSKYIENASINPNLRHIIYIFQKKRTRKTIDTNDVIDRKIKTLQQRGYLVKCNISHQSVVIITPFMGQVVTEYRIDSVLIDVTPILSGPFVMMVYVPTPLGSLPIACAIFAERSLAIYEQILLAISSAIERGFHKCFEPKIVSLGNTVLKDALTSMFPRIVVKPDRVQICREFWEFICDHNNNIEKIKRHKIMQLFKSLIYADDIEEAIQIHFSLVNDDIMKPCLQKMEDVWQNWEQWMGVKVFNGKHIEMPILFTKEFLIQKCKSFSFCVMMDVVTNILESHYHKMTVACKNNDVIGLHTKFLPKIELTLESIQRVEPNDFIVPGDEPNTTYRLNTDYLCCDCKIGVKGRICEHLTSVLNAINYKHTNNSDLEDTDILNKVAGEANEIKTENSEEYEANEMPLDVTADNPMSASSNVSDSIEMKQELDPLEENYDNETMKKYDNETMKNYDNETMENEDNETMENHENNTVVTVDLKAQYEAVMKGLNDEFRRLNRLFRDNPNKANMETMKRLGQELAKIRPTQEPDFSNIFVQRN